MNQTYRQPYQIKIVAWLFIALCTPIFLLLFTVNDTSAQIGIPLLFGPFFIGAVWILWYFRGKFILTKEGITLSQLGKETFLRYQDIYA
ncbi:MAG TPA: hypothetical protein VJ972_09585, partial [Anaerolineales bacterium]|nr:hypothetical protein [Anaerolineales bacterium]